MANPEIAALRAEIASQPRADTLTIEEQRRLFDTNARKYPVASDIHVERTSAQGVPAEWTSAPGADDARVVLYFHGGGYVTGSLDSHRHVCSEIARDFGGRTLAVWYRRAPEHHFPAPIEDAMAGYRYLLSRRIEPRHIALAGDSAGGGIVPALMVALRDAGLPQPACGWCISPWVDLEGIGKTMKTKKDEDPIMEEDELEVMANMYLHGANPRSPLAAPIYADLRGLAPLYIHVGSAERLLDDAIRLAETAGAAEVSVTLEIWPEMLHAWPLYHPVLAAGRRAITAGAAYMRRMTTRASLN